MADNPHLVRLNAAKPRLSWPRRIFPGLTAGMATAIAWMAGIGDLLNGRLGYRVSWLIAPLVVLAVFCALYIHAQKPQHRLEALWSVALFSIIGLYGMALIGTVFLYLLFLFHS